MALRVSAVYVIEHPSGAFYVGATTNLASRWRSHRTQLRNGIHPSRTLQGLAVNGDISQFSIRALLVADREHLTFYEARVLAAFEKRPGFANRTSVARMSFPSASTRARMSRAQKGTAKSDETRRRMCESKQIAIGAGTWVVANKGKTMPLAVGAKISATRKRLFAAGQIVTPTKGVPMSAEQKQKISDTRKANFASGKTVPNRSMLGRKMSDETRARMSAAHKGIAPFAGHKHSAEAREKIAAAGRGRKQSPETIAKRLATSLQRRIADGGKPNGN